MDGDHKRSRTNLKPFIRNGLGALDIAFLRPPDLALPGLSSPPDKGNVILLLQWIDYFTVNCLETFTQEFKRSITEGNGPKHIGVPIS